MRPRVEVCELRLPRSGATDRRSLVLTTARPAVPIALLVWGMTAGATIEALRIGGENQLTGAVPLAAFLPEISFGEYEMLLAPRADGRSAVSWLALGRVPFELLMMPTALVGSPIELVVTGGYEHGALLARMPHLTPTPSAHPRKAA